MKAVDLLENSVVSAPGNVNPQSPGCSKREVVNKLQALERWQLRRRLELDLCILNKS